MRILLLLSLFVLAQAACSFTKDLERHHVELLAAVGPDVPLAEKRDALGYSTVGMMHQAVDKLNPKKGVRYVEAYSKANGELLDTLTAQILRGQQEMTRGQQVAFGLSAVTRPYAKDAIDLIPRFAKKYRQVRAVSRITGNLKDVILGKAVEALGGLLDGSQTAIDGGCAGQLSRDTHREREAEGHTR